MHFHHLLRFFLRQAVGSFSDDFLKQGYIYSDFYGVLEVLDLA
jgi:hypothetical protein